MHPFRWYLATEDAVSSPAQRCRWQNRDEIVQSRDAMAGRAAIPGGRSLADADAAQRMLLTRSSRSVSADPRESNNEPAGRLGREAERAIRRADSATGKRSTFREKERERERERGREKESDSTRSDKPAAQRDYT